MPGRVFHLPRKGLPPPKGKNSGWGPYRFTSCLILVFANSYLLSPHIFIKGCTKKQTGHRLTSDKYFGKLGVNGPATSLLYVNIMFNCIMWLTDRRRRTFLLKVLLLLKRRSYDRFLRSNFFPAQSYVGFQYSNLSSFGDK